LPVIKKPIQAIISDNMMDYGAYVILQRALPDFRDGLKPGARRVLITMHNEKATNFTKSANIEGQVMKIHPHGSTYGTMVKMAQTDRHLVNLVVGEGSFGQATARDLAPAASRYTEIKLADVTIDWFKDIGKNVVDYIPNFDGSIMIPEVLPVKFPNVLTMAQSGVAYGMASSTLSFNLRELVTAMVKYIREGKMNLLVPDFATGGYIVKNSDALKKINLEGSGSLYLRGKAAIEGNEILITEIPYGVTREAIIDKVVDLVKEGKLKEVAEIKDLTGLKGMKVKIRAKRGTDMNMLLEKLYQLTPLQSSVSANNNILVDGTPKVLGVWGIIKEWLKWRKETIVRGLQFDIAKMEKQLHFFRGLEKVLVDIDKAIEIIRRSKEDEIIPNLIEGFGIDEVQANDIANMKLRNINKDYIIRKISEIEKLAEDIKDLKDLVTNDTRLNEYIIGELEDSAKKYGRDRMSKLIEVNTEKIKKVKKKLAEVPNYPVKLFITREGYVKKMGIHANKEDQYVKPGDEIVSTYDTFNNAELLVFGTDCACYKIKIGDIEESTNKSLGIFIKSLADISCDIVGTSILDGLYAFVIIAYDNNKIAKIKLDSFSGNRKKLANSLSKKLKVVGMLSFKEEGKFIFKTTTTTFKVPTSNYELKERWTQGTYGPRKGIVTEIRMA
jgi:DNA gyrase subunit A